MCDKNGFWYRKSTLRRLHVLPVVVRQPVHYTRSALAADMRACSPRGCADRTRRVVGGPSTAESGRTCRGAH